MSVPTDPVAPATTTAEATPRGSPAAYLGIAFLVLLGTGLFGTAAVAQVRRPENAPPARVLGVPAWTLATAGFVSTLAGGLWLRRLV